jgi:selenocysteine lyase/cysteine desulfurase
MLAAAEYDGIPTQGYLDTATYGLPPRATLAACERALTGWRDWEDWHRWEEDGEACRAAFARLIGGRTEDVAIVSAVSVAAGLVAASLPRERRANVVVCERDFQSNLFPWLALESHGVDVRVAPLDRLAEAADDQTLLVAVSAVQSSDGALADLAAIKRTEAWLFVDGTQAVGAVPIDLDTVDFLAVAAYKWLLCPRGLCFLHLRPGLLAAVEPWLAGWKSHRDPYGIYYGLPRDLAADARRLDVSLPWFSAAGARISLELLASLGASRIAAHDLALARRFCEGAGLPPPTSPIVRVPVDDARLCLERLERAGVRAAGRAGAVRVSFHLYNAEADVDRALEALAPHASGA